jgi:transposase
MPKRSGAIHVATTRRTYKGKVYETHLLRRSYREGKKVKHETLGNISHLPPDIIELVRRSLAGERFVPATEAFTVQRSLPHGHVEAILGTLRRIGLQEMISSKRSPERDLVVAMIVERLILPCSKLATTRLWHTSTLAEEVGVVDADEDDLYDALDWLLGRQNRIERKLAAKHLGEGSQVLYDLTSSYYEGRTCPLALFGHDRDRKKGRPIIVYGLLTDGAGCPVAVEVYPGNTADPTTVEGQVEKLRGRFGLGRVVLVSDRGMLTETQLKKLKDYPGIGWISALRSGQIRKLSEEGTLQMSLFDQQDLAEITSPQFPGERLVVCYNPFLAEERRRKRKELIAATEKALQKIHKEVARRRKTPLSAAEIGKKVGKTAYRYKMQKLFVLKIEDGVFSFERHVELIQREEALDGIYVIRTSESARSISAEDAVRGYKRLAQVERAFRCLKGIDLRVRPIHHRTENHVRAHIFLCMLAYYVEFHMRKALRPLLFDDEELDEDRKRRDPVKPAKPSASAKKKKVLRLTPDGLPVQSFQTLLNELGTRCRNLCRVNSQPTGGSFEVLTEPTALQKRAFKLLGV